MRGVQSLVLMIIGVAGCFCLLFGSAISAPALAQGHAGHTAQPPSEKEKPGAVKPPTQPAPQEQVAEDAPQVEITPEQQQLIGVKTVRVSVRPVQKIIRTVGRVEADERKLATINTKIEGWIEKLYVDFTGRYVKKGEPLAEIYSPELLATQQEFISALKWAGRQTGAVRPSEAPHGDHVETPPATGSEPVFDLQKMLAKDAAAALDAARQRLRLWDVSEEQIRKIEETGKPIRTLTLYSPISGFITQKMAVRGMKVMPGEKLFDVGWNIYRSSSRNDYRRVIIVSCVMG